MTILRFKFDAGQYHATPWGRHVNEGAIEWPPSPWRLYRALLATGHRKLGWEQLPETARTLFGKLCGHVPTWWIPAASSAHTRHYMPNFEGATARVIDAFAFTGRLPLYAQIAVALAPSETELLRELMRRLSYLGRAESWVSGDLVDEAPSLGEYHRVQAGPPPSRDPGLYEPVKVLGVQTAADYLLWRQQQIDLELELQLRSNQQEAAAKGKQAPQSIPKKARERLESGLPLNVVEALYAETPALQKDGWSQPPGTEWVTYWIPSDALNSRAPVRTARTKERPVQAVLFALSSNTARSEVLPAFKDALLRGELFHAAAIARADKDRSLPPTLTGKTPDNKPLRGHRHVHYMPLCLNDRDRTRHPSRHRIDHILAWSSEPLDREALRALVRVNRIFHGKIPEIFVSVVGTGTLDEFRSTGPRGIPELGRGRNWVSRTPFVPPRFLKPTRQNSLGGQVIAELTARGFPTPESIDVEVEIGPRRSWLPVERFWELWKQQASPVTVVGERDFQGADDSEGRDPVLLARDWRHFRRERLRMERRPPMALGVGLRITFNEHVSGPLCIGYGSHYGLGVLSVEDPATNEL